jgi:hypothetical protein
LLAAPATLSLLVALGTQFRNIAVEPCQMIILCHRCETNRVPCPTNPIETSPNRKTGTQHPADRQYRSGRSAVPKGERTDQAGQRSKYGHCHHIGRGVVDLELATANSENIAPGINDEASQCGYRQTASK